MQRCLRYKVLGLIAVIAGFLVLYLFPTDRYWIYPRCLFHELTGLDCPGCGSIRSVQCLLHGQFAAAFRFNPLLYFLGAALMVCRRHLHKPVCAWSFVGVIIAFTVARNI